MFFLQHGKNMPAVQVVPDLPVNPLGAGELGRSAISIYKIGILK